jgi:hypothetical protein
LEEPLNKASKCQEIFLLWCVGQMKTGHEFGTVGYRSFIRTRIFGGGWL